MHNFNIGDTVKYIGFAFPSIFNNFGEVLEDKRPIANTSTLPILVDGVVYYVYPENIVFIEHKKEPKDREEVACRVVKGNSRKFSFECACGFVVKGITKTAAESFLYCPKCGKRVGTRNG